MPWHLNLHAVVIHEVLHVFDISTLRSSEVYLLIAIFVRFFFRISRPLIFKLVIALLFFGLRMYLVHVVLLADLFGVERQGRTPQIRRHKLPTIIVKQQPVQVLKLSITGLFWLHLVLILAKLALEERSLR